jgi:hypothetical protein
LESPSLLYLISSWDLAYLRRKKMTKNNQNKVPLLTKEGYDSLKEKLRVLEEEKRPKVVERLKRARSYGDLSENQEYKDAREELELMDTPEIGRPAIQIQRVETLRNHIPPNKLCPCKLLGPLFGVRHKPQVAARLAVAPRRRPTKVFLSVPSV